MIELRWYVDARLDETLTALELKARTKLQYRYSETTYSTSGIVGVPITRMSDWITVPTVWNKP